MKLYDLELSGNCYKVRLFAALANIELEIVPVDFLAGEHKGAAMLALNPFGEIPILVHGEVVLRDAQAILVYLARLHDLESWLPSEPQQMAEVQQWLATAANEIQHGPNAARLVDKFGYELDKPTTLVTSARILGLLNDHLTEHDWLALGHPTIADCAVMPYVAIAPEGGIALDDYPNVLAWIDRIKQLPGFIGMPGQV
ncbi:glutathione S-transferase family protein [Alteromonas lipolytica]|uniref:Glutathione S-transferase n=1 Tax=Alteromonas lipolytica TaxID=1856405 RepID=A0A1E8FFV6_9ALTE|nr:glutathione S-transferase [Alteromonas lipolytica]OFI34825.1 glutathione S-transferase [Alteromonas lipolytica]GGF54291.1 glutathione S-transferase [Alteromonas lipolytica]